MNATQNARRYFVSGRVQGVGFRYFVQRVAEKSGFAGYVRNLRDGRVEIYAAGTEEQLGALRAALERGPNFANVTGVAEEPAELQAEYGNYFTVQHDA